MGRDGRLRHEKPRTMDDFNADDIDRINRALDGHAPSEPRREERKVWVRKRQLVQTPSLRMAVLRDIAARAIEAGILRRAEPPEYPEDESWWPADQ